MVKFRCKNYVYKNYQLDVRLITDVASDNYKCKAPVNIISDNTIKLIIIIYRYQNTNTCNNNYRLKKELPTYRLVLCTNPI